MIWSVSFFGSLTRLLVIMLQVGRGARSQVYVVITWHGKYQEFLGGVDKTPRDKDWVDCEPVAKAHLDEGQDGQVGQEV